MIVNRRLFLCMEGLDGVGKTSVAKSLASRLGYVYFSSPGGVYKKARSIIDDGNLDNLSRYLFYRAATQNDSKLISEILDNSGVICDRYIYSTIAYHAAVDANILSIHNNFDIVIPDRVILLRADGDVRAKRIVNRGDRFRSYLNESEESRAELIFESFHFDTIDTSNNTMEQTVEAVISSLELVFD